LYKIFFPGKCEGKKDFILMAKCAISEKEKNREVSKKFCVIGEYKYMISSK